MARAEAPPPLTEPDVDQVRLEVGETTWSVRVLGRTGSSEARSAPLLLLGFWPEHSQAIEPDLEALAVSRSLASMSPAGLESAFRQARPPKERPLDGRSPKRERGRRR